METTFFVLGMLSIIGAIVVALIVWGVFKIIKLSETIEQQEEWTRNNDRSTWDLIHRLNDDLGRRIDDLERNTVSYVSDAIHESKSYTDSRFDKATSGNNGSKQLIKG